MIVRAGIWKITAFLVAVWSISAHAEQKASHSPDFRFEIGPILSKNCFCCHGPDEAHRKADLRLDDRDVAVEAGAIAPGAPDDSEVVRRITSEDPDERMPPVKSGKQLTAAEISTIKAWIAAGAKYSKHWSYEPPQRPPLPEVSRPE